ncbi:MAG: DUF2470 domain-containing protein [Streptosporangiales bacterium]
MAQHTRVPRLGPAELARTLTSGVVTGTLLAAGVPGTNAGSGAVVRPCNTAFGDVLLLVPDRTGTARHLADPVRSSRGEDVPALLDVLDTPAVPTDLPRARLRLTGWAEPVVAAERRARLLAAADARVFPELLTVGHGVSLYRFDLADVTVTTPYGTCDIDPDDFRGAAPDPLYACEREVAAHLQQHHYDDLTEWTLQRLAPRDACTIRQILVTRVDRYGLDLACQCATDTRCLRIPFPGPVEDEEELGTTLRALRRCACGDG